jgi:Holliday junction resolvase
MSKQKGKRGEREAAAELGELLGCHARRGVQYQGSADSPDVVLEGVNIHVECKRTETLNVYKAIEQAIGDAGLKVPIVWHRRNGKQSVVIIETARLAEFVAETHKSLENKGETHAKCEKA